MPHLRFLLFLLIFPPSTGWCAKVQTLDGDEYELNSFQLDTRGLSATVDGEPIQISTAELLEVDFANGENQPKPDKLRQGPQLTTIHNEIFPLQQFTASQGIADFRTTFSKEVVELSTNQIAYVRLMDIGPESLADWDRLLAQQEAGDLLVLVKKGKDTGQITLDALSGVVQRVNEQSIDFDWDGEPFPVKRSKVAAVVYYHGKNDAARNPFCILHTRDGAIIPCQSLETSKAGALVRGTSLSGIKLALDPSQIAKIDFSAGKLVYLSDLKPLAQKWTPLVGINGDNEFLRRAGEPRFNQAFTGSTLQLRAGDLNGGDPRQEPVNYSRGIALRSRTEIVFNIPAGMRKFQTLAGINPATASQGHVELEFTSKGEPLWQGQIDGNDSPQEIVFSLRNVQRLRIFVDYGENLDFGDQLHLVNPRVSQ